MLLTVAPVTVAMNPAQQQTIAVSNATPPLTASLDHALVTLSVSADGTVVTVTATQATGNDVLHLVDAAGNRADIPIRVAFNAGTIVPNLTLTVTGNPLDPGWLANQVSASVARATQAMPGAQTSIASPAPIALPSGGTTTVQVPVQIAGNGIYFDQSGDTNVTIQQLPIAPMPPALLFYDDDPENVATDGVLYRGTIDAARPVRLYTYHEDADESRRIVVVLTAATPSRVQAIDASAGPNVDVMSVGHAASTTYLTVAPRNEGVVLALDPVASYVLHDVAYAHRETVAEALDLRVLSGGAVTLTVLSLSAGESPSGFLNAAPLPGDGHHRTGVFVLSGYGNESASYAVGGPDASVLFGDRSPQSLDPASSGHDYGDYGILYNLVFTLSNPTGLAANAYLYERPMAGDVRSSFLVDGALVQLGCARESVPYQIAAYALQPHSTYQVTVETMPDGGSNYPLEIGMTATPPAPQTPPLFAPDGCFPKPQPSPAAAF